MNLNRTRWYVQWFFWSLGIYDEFTGKWKTHEVELRGTNLCFFMRVTLVWAPLILLLHVVVIGLVISALTIIPVWAFGVSYYFGGVFGISLTIALVLGTKAVMRSRDRKEWEKREASYDGYVYDEDEIIVPEPEVIKEPKGPGFGKVLWTWIVAAKKKICPSITFNGREVEI